MKVFYAMPFSGAPWDQLVEARRAVRAEAASFGIGVHEQLIGKETAERFAAHDYDPVFIVGKDHRGMRDSDIVIADFSRHSIGRDHECNDAKAIDRRVIAVVPDAHLRDHPWVRMYSDYIVPSRSEAFALARELADLGVPAAQAAMTREEKDGLDARIWAAVARSGASAMEPLFPTELRRRWQLLFGDEYPTVVAWSFQRLPRTLRINPLKIDEAGFREIAAPYGWDLQQTPVAGAYRVPATAHIDVQSSAYCRGLFYLQELASLLPALALDPQPGTRVLDIAAAPGSKTTQIAQLMRDRGDVTAFDSSGERMKALRRNLRRLGIQCVHPVVADGRTAGERYPGKFDRALVDVPCSCDGIIRSKPHKLFEWSPVGVLRNSQIQRELLESAYRCLKPGGALVYSTCAYDAQENEATIQDLLKRHPEAEIAPVSFPGIKARPGLAGWYGFPFDARLAGTLRLYPQDNDTIGFYLAKVGKGR